MPYDLPKGKTAYHNFRTWRIDGTWQALHDELSGDLRGLSAGIVTRAQVPSIPESVKTSFQGGARGYEAAKQTKGRKRNLLVEFLGLVVLVSVLRANVRDTVGQCAF